MIRFRLSIFGKYHGSAHALLSSPDAPLSGEAQFDLSHIGDVYFSYPNKVVSTRFSTVKFPFFCNYYFVGSVTLRLQISSSSSNIYSFIFYGFLFCSVNCNH